MLEVRLKPKVAVRIKLRPGTSRETLEGGPGQMGTTAQQHKEGEKDGQVAHAGGGPLPQLCSRTEPRQPPAPGLHFCSVPPKEGVFHILSFTLVV